MRPFMLGVMLAALLGPAAARAESNLTLDALRALCMETHARYEGVMAAADAAGWAKGPNEGMKIGLVGRVGWATERRKAGRDDFLFLQMADEVLVSGTRLERARSCSVQDTGPGSDGLLAAVTALYPDIAPKTGGSGVSWTFTLSDAPRRLVEGDGFAAALGEGPVARIMVGPPGAPAKAIYIEWESVDPASLSVEDLMTLFGWHKRRQQWQQAFVPLKLAAERGSAEAQGILGAMYSKGLGTGADPVEGVRWYRLSADSNNPGGLVGLGLAYRDGKGAAQDPAEAARLFRKAAEGDTPYAQYLLGLLYDQGMGVPQDAAEARSWITRAATGGSPEAAQWLKDHPA